MYKVESDFEYKGYRCVVVFTDRGHRCGYVGVPSGHMLYKKRYTDYLDISKSELDDEKIGNRGMIPILSAAFDDDERARLDYWFNVHGGLTYSRDGNYPIESDLWWFGFDCAHYNDGKDLDLVEKYWGDDPRIKERLKIDREFSSYYEDNPIRSNEYVEDECKALVEQIIKLDSQRLKW